MEQKLIQIRTVFPPDDPLHEKALLVKKEIGVKSWTEVVRILFKTYDLKEKRE